MQQTKKLIIAAGGTLCFAGSCLSATGGRWIVPPLIFFAGAKLVALGVNQLHKSEELKRKRRAERHCNDADKLRETQAVRAAYYDFKCKGLIK